MPGVERCATVSDPGKQWLRDDEPGWGFFSSSNAFVFPSLLL